MEILGYLRTSGRRRWLLIAVPVLAGAAVLPVGLQQPQHFTADATVVVPSPSSDAGPAVLRQVGEGFVSVAQLRRQHRQAIAIDLGTSPGAVGRSLSVTQVGTTNLVRLTYVGDKANLTERGARSAATQALQVYRGRQLTAAESARDALQAQYDEATAAVNAFVASSGSTSPPADYQARANTLARLDAEIALARAGGSRARWTR